MRVTVAIVMSLLGWSILVQTTPSKNTDDPTKENFAKVRNQMLTLASSMEHLNRSFWKMSVQRQLHLDDIERLDADVSQLNSTMQTMDSDLNNAYMSEEDSREKISDMKANITQLNRELQLVADRIKLLTARACPSGFGYSTDGLKCYKTILNALTWDEARSRCSKEATGAQLVTVTDSGTNVAVIKIAQYVKDRNSEAYAKTCVQNFWTAGRQLNDDCNAEFVWQPTQTVIIPMTYKNWLWGEPTCSGGNEHCIHYGKDYMNIRAWNDYPCSVRMCAICEYRPIGSKQILATQELDFI